MEENIIPERGIKMIPSLPPAFANSRGEKTVSSVLFEEIERIDIRGNIQGSFCSFDTKEERRIFNPTSNFHSVPMISPPRSS